MYNETNNQAEKPFNVSLNVIKKKKKKRTSPFSPRSLTRPSHAAHIFQWSSVCNETLPCPGRFSFIIRDHITIRRSSLHLRCRWNNVESCWGLEQFTVQFVLENHRSQSYCMLQLPKLIDFKQKHNMSLAEGDTICLMVSSQLRNMD